MTVVERSPVRSIDPALLRRYHDNDPGLVAEVLLAAPLQRGSSASSTPTNPRLTRTSSATPDRPALRQAIDRLGFTVRATAAAHLEVAASTPAGRALAPSAGALMTAQADSSWTRVKACARDTCRWLFYDTTRNRSRTWCTSTTCGSREKAKRAYRRQLAKQQA